jgi:putative ATPase
MESLARPVIMQGSLDEVPDLIARHGEGQVRFDVVVGRNVLTHSPDKAAAARAIVSLLGHEGRLALAETVPRHIQRLYRLVDLSALDEDLRQRLVAAEEAIYSDPDDALVNWDAADLRSAFEAAGLSNLTIQIETATAQQHIGPDQLARWFGAGSDRQRPGYAQRLSGHLSADEISRVQALFERQLRERTVAWASQMAYLTARK